MATNAVDISHPEGYILTENGDVLPMHLREAETGSKAALADASVHFLLLIFTLQSPKHGGFHAENDFPLLLVCPPWILHTVK